MSLGSRFSPSIFGLMSMGSVMLSIQDMIVCPSPCISCRYD